MKRRLAAAMVTMVLLLTGCMDRSGQLPEYTPAAEDCLVVYTSHKEEVWWPIVKEFEERTGIWVDVVTGAAAAHRPGGRCPRSRCDVWRRCGESGGVQPVF